MIYAGQSSCYEKTHEVLEKYLSVEVSATQIYRVTDLHGEQIGKEMDTKECSLTPVRGFPSISNPKSLKGLNGFYYLFTNQCHYTSKAVKLLLFHLPPLRS